MPWKTPTLCPHYRLPNYSWCHKSCFMFFGECGENWHFQQQILKQPFSVKHSTLGTRGNIFLTGETHILLPHYPNHIYLLSLMRIFWINYIICFFMSLTHPVSICLQTLFRKLGEITKCPARDRVLYSATYHILSFPLTCTVWICVIVLVRQTWWLTAVSSSVASPSAAIFSCKSLSEPLRGSLAHLLVPRSQFEWDKRVAEI